MDALTTTHTTAPENGAAKNKATTSPAMEPAETARARQAVPFITTSGLRKSFQMGTTMVHALAGVDMAIDEGTFQAIM